jgi:hypothetical protein
MTPPADAARGPWGTMERKVPVKRIASLTRIAAIHALWTRGEAALEETVART